MTTDKIPLQEGELILPVNGASNYYITSYGRMWSVKRPKVKGGWKVTTKSRKYYRTYSYIDDNNVRTCRMVHTLVGRHYLPWKEGMFILHKDETLSEPYVNRLDNLWLGTQKENIQDCYNKGRGRYSANYTPELIQSVLADDTLSSRKCAIKYNIGRSVIQTIRRKYRDN